MTVYQKIAVIGGGAWGTALAQSACLAGRDVTIWAREAETVAAINETHENRTFLPGVHLHPDLKAFQNLYDLDDADALLLVVPAQFVRNVTLELNTILNRPKPLIICAKGIETATGKLMSEVLEETMPNARLAVLSGPSFADDVVRGLPTAVSLASQDSDLGRDLAVALGHKALRPYWSDDVIGVQLGGAIKNVLAIAAGIVVGKKLGASAHASLITRGFAELLPLAASYGAKQETLMGLSGLGDLVLTCSSPQSRNMSLGIALGEGQTLQEILGGRKSVSEGVYTASAVDKIAQQKALDMPIASAVAAIVSDKFSVDDAIDNLLARPLRAER